MGFLRLSELKRGQSAIITGFTDVDLSIKLMEMGCLPGEQISISHVAPLGDPIAVNVCGYLLSLRIAEADTVVISAES
jgi:ferrous iron transport protein A